MVEITCPATKSRKIAGYVVGGIFCQLLPIVSGHILVFIPASALRRHLPVYSLYNNQRKDRWSEKGPQSKQPRP